MEIIEFISNLRWYTEYYVHFSYYYAISEISDYYYLYKVVRMLQNLMFTNPKVSKYLWIDNYKNIE